MTPQVRGVVLALGAGLCTTIGGACVFFLSSFRRLPLAVTMAISAGVMVYVSFVEIFEESKVSLHQGLAAHWATPMDDKMTSGCAYLFATLCFFGGWFIASLMDFGLNILVQSCHFGPSKHDIQIPTVEGLIRNNDPCSSVVELSSEPGDHPREGDSEDSTNQDSNPDDKVGLNTRLSKSTRNTVATAAPAPASTVEDYSTDERRPATECKGETCWPFSLSPWGRLQALCEDRVARSDSEAWEVAHAQECFRRDNRKFLQMGVFTALALSLHNIPEGVATFIGSIASPKLGASVAIAIGIHNIPEGFAVSVPLYFGTGKKWPSFLYSLATGFAEPVGALLAWAILGNNANPLALGLAFGFVCGIMSNIALRELLPASYKYDPCNQVTTTSFLGGMLIMAFSLILFEFQ